MNFLKVILFLFLFSLLLFSCTKRSDINTVVVKGLTALYKGQFKEASLYITPSSHVVVGFIQAITSKAKREMMQRADVKIQVLDIDVLPGDSIANVEIGVKNYVDMASKVPVYCEKIKKEIFVLKKIKGEWLIDIQSK